MRMAKRRCGSKTTALLVLAGVVLLPGSLALRDSPRLPPEADPVSLSCKPRPPVGVRIVSTGSSTFRVEIESDLAVADATVSIGAATTEQVLIRSALWRGALAAGEARSLDVQFGVPGAATEVWAEVDVVSGPGVRQRSVSSLPTGLVSIPKPLGRITTHPATGETIVEFQGEMRGAR